MDKKGMLIVISAPAGCGKDTIVHGLFREFGEFSKYSEFEVYKNKLKLHYSVSATTRAMRTGEEEGVHYYFITREKFERLIGEGEFLEYTEYCGNYYGTRRKTIMNTIEEGGNIILKIEAEGAANIVRMFPDAVLIFILPPSLTELRRRLVSRGTEDDNTIELRIQRARIELANAGDYKYHVTNDDLQTAINEVADIILSEIDRRDGHE
ncbi:MAG: guanylate kinase [Oscillospiraceae bacterium]|nr:guanylate kinase [Oscillospiraceae bacterium]